MKMKALLLSPYSRCIWRTAVLGLAITLPVAAADSPNQRLTPVDVLAVMHRVADWQLAHPSAHSATDWTQAAGDAGMMALAGISGGPKYRDALLAMGEANGWKPGPRMYHADDLAIGQTFAGLYLLYRDPKMIAPLRSRLEAILSAPPEVESLDFHQPYDQVSQIWSWCDSLFMAPPVWMQLFAATGDERYLDFAVKNWWRTTDYLYDPGEQHLLRPARSQRQENLLEPRQRLGHGRASPHVAVVAGKPSEPRAFPAVVPRHGGDHSDGPATRWPVAFKLA
jgi:unsaturated rhamnogalacturonyl hydrolase